MSHHVPQFQYFIYHSADPVQAESSILTTPLPMNRKGTQDSADTTVTYEDYFHAIRSFLEKNNFKVITLAVSQHTGQDIPSEAIEQIHIYIEKHGEFYHPARIEVILQEKRIQFVANVAISDTGKSRIREEYEILQKLSHEFPYAFIPKVYGYGNGNIKNGIEIPIFIGEWFEGYHEFHISRHTHSSEERRENIECNGIAVWDPVQGRFFLSPDQTRSLYTQIAMILTCYYNLETFEQIFPWHHAAGDFVIKVDKDKVAVRLITVRDYHPLVDNSTPDAESILAALLLFFLNISVRTRLDRLDGVGDIVWANDIAVEGTVNGFFQGLKLHPLADIFPIPLDSCFRQYLSSSAEADLYELLEEIIHIYNHKSPELSVIRQNLKSHAKTLYQAIISTD